MQRSFLRAGVKLKYSEGFNPHPYISVALPLSVGAESMCELMDVEIYGGFPNNANNYLPDGLEITGLFKPLRKFNAIKWIDVKCRLYYNDILTDETIDVLNTLFSSETLIISKRTKSGYSDIDIAEHIRDAHITLCDDNSVEISMHISAQQPTVSHKDIMEIAGYDKKLVKPYQINVKRIELFDKDMVLFR